jgi:hypothetical protein
MTLEASSAALVADVETYTSSTAPAAVRLGLPANDPADPETGWATRNPKRAMLFLFVSPRDCSAVAELLAI